MAGLEELVRGRTDWGPANYGLYPLANAMVRDSVQPAPTQAPTQTQAYYANNAPMPGAMQAWETMGVPPVMYHPNSPYATLAYRTVTDPFGQMAVQPLTGFPSVYPHVLPGVAPNPFQTMFPMLQAMMPPMVPLQWGAMQQPKRGGTGGTTGTRNTTGGTTTNSQPAAPQWVHYGNARAKADAMPVSPENQAWLASLEPPVTQTEQPASSPWYAPIIDDFARLGIRFPLMDYQPQIDTPASSPAPEFVGPLLPEERRGWVSVSRAGEGLRQAVLQGAR